MAQAKPFGEVKPIPYRSRFSVTEYQTLKLGLFPRQMEDKWFGYYQEPFLILGRSWTGMPVYKFKLKRVIGGAVAGGAVCAADMLTDSDSEYQAKLLDFIVSNLILGQGKPFPAPARLEGKPSDLYQHIVVGRAYPQIAVPKKPWWKFSR
jgi:hypothetical protein